MSKTTLRKGKQDDKFSLAIREIQASNPDNKKCFDCEQRGPTYINTTIGVPGIKDQIVSQLAGCYVQNLRLKLLLDSSQGCPMKSNQLNHMYFWVAPEIGPGKCKALECLPYWWFWSLYCHLVYWCSGSGVAGGRGTMESDGDIGLLKSEGVGPSAKG